MAQCCRIVFADEVNGRETDQRHSVRMLLRFVDFETDTDIGMFLDARNASLKVRVHVEWVYPLECPIGSLCWVFGTIVPQEKWHSQQLPELHARLVSCADCIDLQTYIRSIEIARMKLNMD